MTAFFSNGDGDSVAMATAEGRLYNCSPRLACLPGVGCGRRQLPPKSGCINYLQIEGWGFYNRSSAVVANALMSRGRRANPVLTYETALRRFFASRRWRNPMMMFFSMGMVIRWWRFFADVADDGWQPPKGGCIIVAPGWLAYLGLVVEGGGYRRRAVV